MTTQEKKSINVTPTEAKILETMEAAAHLIGSKTFDQKMVLFSYFYFLVADSLIKNKKLPFAITEEEQKFFVLSPEEHELFLKRLGEAMAEPGEEYLLSH